ncbi:MAG: DNA-binding protein [Euryarchaeota archaeon]|nr:DNA-binding protein [Euryarchaeota archaeon]
MDDELEQIRRRRLEQLQAQQAGLQQSSDEIEEARARKNALLRQILTPEARERLNSIRLTRPDFAESVESQLIALYQSGRLAGQITDEQLKKLLKQITPKKQEIRIRRR